MPGIFGPSVKFKSNAGGIYPTQMSTYSYDTVTEQTQNILRLGTNIIDPVKDSLVDVTFTYTLSNGKTITINKHFYGTPPTNISYAISFQDGGSISGINGNSTDAIYIVMDPYTEELDDVEHWAIIKHIVPPGSPVGYYYQNEFPNLGNTFEGALDDVDEEGELKADGGSGLLDTDSDTIPFPTLPVVNFMDTNMIKVYSPTTGELQSFASYLWGGTFLQNIEKIMNDPMEAIIGCSLIPVTPTTSNQNIYVGNTDSGVASKRVTQQFYYIDFGKIDVDEYIGTYYDWAPYTSAEIYLPFIGTRQIDINEITGSQLWLQYMVDIFSGNCTAMLHIERRFIKNPREQLNGILYHWNGNMSTNCPISAKDYTQQLKTHIGTISTLAIGAATVVATGGASTPVVVGAAGASLGVAAKEATTPTPVQHSGNVTANYGMMSIQTPYIILSRANPVVSGSIKTDAGFNSKITAQIGTLSGYVKMKDIHVAISGATDAECKEIEKILKDGIHI